MTKRVPAVNLMTRVRNEALDGPNPFEWKSVNTADIFEDKLVILFALPGAFTPTCSTTHLPGYEEKYDEFKSLGVDDVICLSVNDAFVMYQWGKSLGVEKVHVLPDGNADFTREMGMLVDKSNVGFGPRSWRYSMLVKNGEILKVFAEEGNMDNCPTDPFEVSDADTMLAYIKSGNVSMA